MQRQLFGFRFLFVWKLQSSIFELTSTFLVLLYQSFWKNLSFAHREKDVNEQLYVYSYCLFVFKPVLSCFLFFYLTQFIVASYKQPLHTNWWNEKNNNLAGQKIRQLNFDLSKLSSNDYWIFGHWTDDLIDTDANVFLQKAGFFSWFSAFLPGMVTDGRNWSFFNMIFLSLLYHYYC